MPAKISIVIPVYRGGAMFQRCLEGIARLDPAPGEVIVVVDGDDADSEAVAEPFVQRGVIKRRISLAQNSGPATARNRGAALATGELLLFLDADVVPEPTLVAKVAAAFAEEEQLDALIGSYDGAPGDPAFLSQYRNLLHHYVHQTGSEQAFTFWGACGAVRRDWFERVGGFDADIPEPAMEDIELGQRLVQAGARIALRKNIQVKHLKPWGVRSLLRTDIFQRALPWSRFLRRQGGALPADLNLDHGARLSAILAWLLVASLTLLPWLPMAAWLSVVAGIGLIWLNRGFYGFLLKRRGLRFAVLALPWHWLYFLYASASYAYVFGLERFLSADSKA